MAETSYDPNKVFVGTRLLKDTDDSGVILDESGEWKSGRLLIELFDTKTGGRVDGKEVNVTRAKYAALREDLDAATSEDVIKEHFPKVTVAERSQTDLQAEAERSAKETADREKANAEAEAKAAELRKAVVDGETAPHDNVRPVGDPDEVPSNPEQKLSAEEVAAKGGTAVGSDVDNPEQSGTNVGEDKFAKSGKAEKTTATTKVERNVTPVKE